MPDEVLTNLCSVCHAAPHKYKCPGCGARTCSLPCIKKHKSRTECSGRHDPTGFVPIEKLRTPAGIDHDYNFISAIDRAKQRARRDIVEERGLLREEELHPEDEDKAFFKVWKGDQLHHVPDKYRDRRPGLKPRDHHDKRVRRRLRALDIDARTMPEGMTRQKENRTTFNRRSRQINWQVELFVYGASRLDARPTRILHQALDGKPLHEVLANSIKWMHGHLEWERRNQEQLKVAQAEGRIAELQEKSSYQNTKNTSKKRKRAQPHMQLTQDPKTSAWPSNNLLLQDAVTGQWSKISDKGAASVPLNEAEEAVCYMTWQFYLHQPCHPVPGGRKAVIRLSSTNTLAEVLSGRTIVEFPTLYAFPPRTQGPPEGFVQVPGTRKPDETESSESDSDSGSGSDSDSSSSSGSSSDEKDEPVAKKIKVDVHDKGSGAHMDNRDDGGNRNGFNSRGGRLQQQNWRVGRAERGSLRGRGHDRGRGRGRGRGQQNPRGRTYGRPGSSDGPGSNNYSRHGNSNNVRLGTRAEPESEEEGEIMSDDGGPPDTMDIDRGPPDYHRPYNQAVMVNDTSRTFENQRPTGWSGTAAVQQTPNTAYTAEQRQLTTEGNGAAVAQQSKASGLGLVNYDSDSD